MKNFIRHNAVPASVNPEANPVSGRLNKMVPAAYCGVSISFHSPVFSGVCFSISRKTPEPEIIFLHNAASCKKTTKFCRKQSAEELFLSRVIRNAEMRTGALSWGISFLDLKKRESRRIGEFLEHVEQISTT